MSQLQNPIWIKIRAFTHRVRTVCKLPILNRICQLVNWSSRWQNHRILIPKRVLQLALMKKMALCFFFLCSVCWGQGNLELLVSPDEIEKKLREVAAEINREYRNKELTVVVVMKGAICIGADLIRHLEVPFTLEYMKASSYGQRGTKQGELKIAGIENLDLTSKHLLIVDDIFDTGNTMTKIVELLQKGSPKSLKTLVLLLKDIPRQTT